MRLSHERGFTHQNEMGRFQEPQAYAPTGAYKLLPFKFTRLNEDSEYVLTNFAGEHIVLKRETLFALVERSGTLDPQTRSLLRSRHFINYEGERSPIELLALKFRSRYARLPEFTSLHIFVTTLRCDHSCPYCQVSRQSEDRAAYDMSTAVADRALDFVFRSPSKALKIEFQGGEPLLNFDLLKYVVLAANRRNLDERRDLSFVIATTMSLLTDEILDFCAEHCIDLSTSLDGPEQLHNSNRPRPGRNSHQKFVEGLERARDRLGFDKVSALMTTTAASLTQPREIINEYLRLGFSSIFLRPLSPYGFALKTKAYKAYEQDRWLDFYQEGLEYIIQLNRRGIEFSEHYASIVLKKMLTSADPGYVDLMSPAGAGIAGIVFNYDGDVYATDESRMLAEMGDTTFRLGNLNRDSYEDIILSDVLLDTLEDSVTQSAPMCSDCAFEPFCGADPVFHHATQGDVVGHKAESAFCSRNMAIFRLLISLMRTDVFVSDLFRRWATR